VIVVRLKGGLGNQLFQYGFGRALSIMKSSPLVFDKTWYFVNALTRSATPRRLVLDRFRIRDCSIKLMPVKYCLMEKKNRSGQLPRMHDMIFISENRQNNIDEICRTDNCYFDGYWQNCLLQNITPRVQGAKRG